jgi:trimeric autotransporter adhesin
MSAALYMGGGFTQLGGVDRNFLAAVDKFGNLTGWSPVANGEVRALLFHNNGTLGPVIYAGGAFSTINGPSHPHSRLVALNTVGVDDTRFDGTVNGEVVNAIAVLDSSGLYVGGKFDSIGNPAVTSPNVAKLFPHNGTINTGFVPNANGAVNALVAVPDLNFGLDVVYIGGAFGDLRGAARLAKVDGDSGLPIRTATGQLQFRGVDGAVNVLTMEDDGTSIYVGGAFNNVLQATGQIARPGGLAQIDTFNGIVGARFDPAPNTGSNNGRPQALATLGPFTLMAGGAFTAIGGAPIANFALLDHLFGTGTAISRYAFPTGPVSALAVSGNNIYVGGRFNGFNAPVNGSSDAGVRGNFAAVEANSGALVP